MIPIGRRPQSRIGLIWHTGLFILFFVCVPGLFGWIAATCIWSSGGPLWLGILVIVVAASFLIVTYAGLSRLGKLVEKRKAARIASGSKIPARLEAGRLPILLLAVIPNLIVLPLYAGMMARGVAAWYLYLLLAVSMLIAAGGTYNLIGNYPVARRLAKLRLRVTPVPLRPAAEFTWRIAGKTPASGARIFLVYNSAHDQGSSGSSWEWRTIHETDLPVAASTDGIGGEFKFPETDRANFVGTHRQGGWFLRFVIGAKWAQFPLPVEIPESQSDGAALSGIDEPAAE